MEDQIIDGNEASELLTGGDGNDILTGGLGDDTLDGAAGTDVAAYDDIDVPVDVVLDGSGNGTATRETGFSLGFEDVPVALLSASAPAATDFVGEALAGNFYFNVHTSDFPGGEIRGQLDTVVSDETDAGGVRTLTLTATLDAAQEPADASSSEATGTGDITFVIDGGTVTYSADLSVSGLATSDLLPVAGVSSIHIHNAPAGVNGPVILDIVQDAGGDIDGAALSPDADTGDGDVFSEVTETDELVSIEGIEGSDDGDTVINTMGLGNSVNGNGGDDVIAGGGGVDSLDGGDGTDTNSFSTIGAEMVASLASGVASYEVGPEDGSGPTVFETFANFENLDGSPQDDILSGDAGANVLTGNDGNDALAGGGGDDTLDGGAGDDNLRGGMGNDALNGGDGTDTADFSDIGMAVTVNLVDETASYGDAADSLDDIENLTGSANDDALDGDDGDNLLAGGAGADTLAGGAGDDTIRGDAVGSGAAIVVSFTNELAEGGTFLTPVWFGFHDGATFDLYTVGEAASTGLERLAEDGITEAIAAEFNNQAPGGIDAVVIGADGVPGPLDPGETGSITINVDPSSVGQGFFTWATMVIPSNDAFLASPDDPLAVPIFDEDGDFLGARSVTLSGAAVLDSGTEENTEESAAFLNQSAPDQGTPENSTVGAHPGFNGSVANPDAEPVNVLGGTTAPGAVIDPVEGDFTADDGPVLSLSIDLLEGSDDVLQGGAGNDQLEGGGGSDTFVFEIGGGSDTVLDFEAGADGDVNDISAFGISDLAVVLAAASQDGDDVFVDLGGGDTIRWLDVDAGALVAENFILADAEDDIDVTEVLDDAFIEAFGTEDAILLDTMLVDSNGDGRVTFGSNGLLDIDGPEAGERQIAFDDDDLPREGVRLVAELADETGDGARFLYVRNSATGDEAEAALMAAMDDFGLTPILDLPVDDIA